MAICFPSRADLFSEQDWCAGNQKGSHKSCLPVKTGKESTKCIQLPYMEMVLKPFHSMFLDSLTCLNLDKFITTTRVDPNQNLHSGSILFAQACQSEY